jgi:ATP-binding cassette subfamily A (ABC1) protein 3
MIFAIGMAFIPTGIITFIVKEREFNVKHQHLISGVSIPAYWLSTYTWDIVKHIGPTIICCLCVEWFNLKQLSEKVDNVYLTVWLLFLLFGIAVAPFCYVSSFLFKNYASAQFITFLINIFLGAILGPMGWFMRAINETTRDIIDVLQWPLRLHPMFCFGFGMNNMTNRKFYQVIYGEDEVRDSLDMKLAGGDVLFMCIDAVLYMVLVFVIERYSSTSIFKCFGAKDPGVSDYIKDDEVEREKVTALETSPMEVACLVKDLRQIYGNALTKKPNVAV